MVAGWQAPRDSTCASNSPTVPSWITTSSATIRLLARSPPGSGCQAGSLPAGSISFSTTASRGRAESDVKRNIPGRCGNALAVSGNPGWGDGGRDASGAGGTGAAGRAQGRGAEPSGDRAGARPGGPDDQSGAAPQRPAERRLPA